MAMTPAERQARYRRNRHKAGADNLGEYMLSTRIDMRTRLALTRLARRDGVTQREMLERLITAADDRVIAGLNHDAPEWDAYFFGPSGTTPDGEWMMRPCAFLCVRNLPAFPA